MDLSFQTHRLFHYSVVLRLSWVFLDLSQLLCRRLSCCQLRDDHAWRAWLQKCRFGGRFAVFGPLEVLMLPCGVRKRDSWQRSLGSLYLRYDHDDF